MWEFVNAHPLACYMVFSAFVGALPSVGRMKNPAMRFVVKFLNGLALNFREALRKGTDRASDSVSSGGSGPVDRGAGVRFTERGI